MRITTIDVSPRTTRLKLSGELDVATELLVAGAMTEAVGGGRGRLEVDLSRVSFMDCSGVRVLLRGRRAATAAGTSFRLGARSTAVQRMLLLAGVAALFPGIVR
jgi:anti-sigma B factor antagonist